MRVIKLPEPPSGSSGMPEIFEAGVYNVIRRAVIISNGFAGAENQSIGLVRALGLSDNQFLYHVLRPRGGINEWLRWLPVSLHKKVDYVIRRVFGDQPRTLGGKKIVPYLADNFGNAGLSSILEADAKQIATMARETFEKEGPLLVVASGRDTISLSSSIKHLAPQNVFVVQIQHPRTHLNRFDLVVTPHHDYYPLTPNSETLQISICLNRSQLLQPAGIHQTQDSVLNLSIARKGPSFFLHIFNPAPISFSAHSKKRKEKRKKKSRSASESNIHIPKSPDLGF